MVESRQDIFITALKNTYALETHAADVTANQASRLDMYPELQSRISQHNRETQQQIQRLEQALAKFNESPSTLKDMVLRAVGNLQTMFHATASDEVLKGSFAAVSLEAYEIAAYKSLIAMAEDCGEHAIAQTMQQSLREEEEMYRFLDSNIANVTRKYLAKAVAGQESSSGIM